MSDEAHQCPERATRYPLGKLDCPENFVGGLRQWSEARRPTLWSWLDRHTGLSNYATRSLINGDEE